MYTYTRCKVLLPERILFEKENCTTSNFNLVVQEYLLRYRNYKFLYVDGPFAVCDREDDVKERRRK
jgi:hypothetical protein